VPQTLPYLLFKSYTTYSALAIADYTVAANELFVSSAAKAAGAIAKIDAKWVLDTPTAWLYSSSVWVSTDVATNCYGAAAPTDEKCSLMYQTGCGMSDFWDDLPWCVLGTGRYNWKFSDATCLWYKVDDTLLYSEDPTYTDWVSPLTSKFQALETALGGLAAADRRNAGGGDANVVLELRLTCLFRHYNVLQLMLKCASTMLHHLMMVDSGCRASDVSSERYGCLCRRRAKYLIMQALPEPTVKGKALSAIVADVILMEFHDANASSTEGQTSGDSHSTVTTSPPRSNSTSGGSS
jgi:hypothetical protein